MAMEINSVYGNYASTYTNSRETKQTKETKSASELAKANETKKAESTTQTSQDYLNNLRKKYSNINITVADFKSEKQELSYMLGCSGGNNIVISQNIINQMAQDPATAAKYEKVISDIPNAAKDIKERVESTPGSKLIASGAKIDKDGKVTYWSVSSRIGEGPGTKEKMQKMLEEKRAEKKKQEKAETARKEKLKEQEKLEEKQAERRAEEKEQMELLLAKGDSVDDVISKIGNGDAEVVSEAVISSMEAGSRLNLTV